jgi:hypothetical protein
MTERTGLRVQESGDMTAGTGQAEQDREVRMARTVQKLQNGWDRMVST